MPDDERGSFPSSHLRLVVLLVAVAVARCRRRRRERLALLSLTLAPSPVYIHARPCIRILHEEIFLSFSLSRRRQSPAERSSLRTRSLIAPRVSRSRALRLPDLSRPNLLPTRARASSKCTVSPLGCRFSETRRRPPRARCARFSNNSDLPSFLCLTFGTAYKFEGGESERGEATEVRQKRGKKKGRKGWRRCDTPASVRPRRFFSRLFSSCKAIIRYFHYYALLLLGFYSSFRRIDSCRLTTATRASFSSPPDFSDSALLLPST